MAAPTKCICQFIAERIHMEFAVDALRAAIERNKVRIDRVQSLRRGIARQLANARPPRETDGLSVGHDAPQETQSRLCHTSLDLFKVNAVRDDVCLAETEAALEGALKLLVAVRLDRNADNACRKRPLEILAHCRAIDTKT